jgi:uncharacterized protein involved in type VI secretion and phage assembly
VAAGAATGVEALGWNPDLKIGVSAPSIPLAAAVDPPSSPTVSKALSGSKVIRVGFASRAKDYVINPMARTPVIASALAKARFLEHESHYVRASGEADGNPFLLAGCNAVVTNVGVRFSGTYYVTQARHIYRAGGYKVEFEVSGRNPYTLGHLTGQDPELNKIFGAVVAIVTDVNDPMMEGRMKVKFPWMPKDNFSDLSSSWARMASLGGGKSGGIFFTPEVNDEVLVIFEQGDVNFPYIVGVLWNKMDRPPAQVVVAGQVTKRIIQSRTGHEIVLDDTPGQEKITILDKNKNGIEIDAVTNAMTIKTAGNLTLDVGGKFVVNSKLDFEIESKTQGSIKATTKLDLESQVAATVKAGASELDLQAATAALKGPTVSVKGSAMVEVQGALVKIN